MNLKVDITQDFFQLNPHLRGFKWFKNKDGKVLMKIAAYAHRDSPISSLSEEEKLEEIPRFDPSKHEKLIKEFVEKTLSNKQKQLRLWKIKLEERTDLLNSEEYTIESMEWQDQILARHKKFWDEYLKIEKEVLIEEQSSVNVGGVEDTLTEKL